MRNTIFALMLAALLPSLASAVAAPSTLTNGPVSANTANLDWAEDTTVTQWNIYLGGVLRYQPFRSDTSVPSTSRRRFLMTNLPSQASIVVTMRALAPGQPISAESAALTITSSTVPVTYVLNPPGVPILISGSAGGGGDATAANQVIGNASLSAINGKTVVVNTGAVSVSSSALPSGASTEATLSSLNGKATVINTGAVSVSSSALPAGAATSAAQATGNASLASLDGKTVVVNTGAVSVSSSALPAGAATEATLSSLNGKAAVINTGAVSISSSVAIGIAAPATGQTVNVSNTVNTTLQTAATGLAVNVSNTVTTQNTGGVSVTNPATAAVQIAGSITNTVTVGTHAVTINSAATGLAVNVSNTVTTTNSGGVSVTNPATAAVQIAGSVTNTVNVQGPISSTVAVGTNPVLIGGRAATTIQAAVSDGALVPIQLTKHGRVVTANQAMPEAVTRTTTTISASTAETAILVSGTAGVFWDIDAISVINTDNATNTRIDFRAASGGPVVYSMGAAKAFGGFVFTPPVPLLQESAASNWTAQCSASATDIRINVVAHQRK